MLVQYVWKWIKLEVKFLECDDKKTFKRRCQYDGEAFALYSCNPKAICMMHVTWLHNCTIYRALSDFLLWHFLFCFNILDQTLVLHHFWNGISWRGGKWQTLCWFAREQVKVEWASIKVSADHQAPASRLFVFLSFWLFDHRAPAGTVKMFVWAEVHVCLS